MYFRSALLILAGSLLLAAAIPVPEPESINSMLSHNTRRQSGDPRDKTCKFAMEYNKNNNDVYLSANDFQTKSLNDPDEKGAPKDVVVAAGTKDYNHHSRLPWLFVIDVPDKPPNMKPGTELAVSWKYSTSMEHWRAQEKDSFKVRCEVCDNTTPSGPGHENWLACCHFKFACEADTIAKPMPPKNSYGF